jgi:hypothetical protein
LRNITYLVLDSTALYVGDHFEEEIVQTSRESHHPVNIESSHLSLVLLPIGQSPAGLFLFCFCPSWWDLCYTFAGRVNKRKDFGITITRVVSEWLLTVAASHPSRQLAFLHHINLTKKSIAIILIWNLTFQTAGKLFRDERNISTRVYFVENVMGTIMYAVCLILLILYSEFYHRYLISDDWPG